MIELYAFPALPDQVLPSLAVASHLVGLDILEARRLQQLPFLNAIFVNRPHVDSVGAVVALRFANGDIGDAIIFTPAELDALANRYLPWRATLDRCGDVAADLERALWRFLADCRERRLTLVSTSRLALQEYE